MDIKYNFGVPGYVIWGGHIIMGATLFYIGWLLFENEKVSKYLIIALMFLGLLAMLYHTHLAYLKLHG